MSKLSLSDFVNVDPMVKDQESSNLLRCMEELNELSIASQNLAHAMFKCLRYGPQTRSPLWNDGKSNMTQIESEVADLLTRLERLFISGFINKDNVYRNIASSTKHEWDVAWLGNQVQVPVPVEEAREYADIIKLLELQEGHCGESFAAVSALLEEVADLREKN